MNRKSFVTPRILLVTILVPSVATAVTIYVDPDATAGANDGSTWVNAYLDLQPAVDDAAGMTDDVEIQIAKGTYKPDPTILGTAATFQLIGKIALKGGFAGISEPVPDQRDTELYETILSGDIGIQGDTNDNVNHVITIENNVGLAEIEGFTVTRGNGNNAGTFPAGYGGAIHMNNANLNVQNCKFVLNAAYRGGAIFTTESTLHISDCIFTQNASRDMGGALEIIVGTTSIHNCEITDNDAADSGGGIYMSSVNADQGASALIQHCQFARNTTTAEGGGFACAFSSPAILDCRFLENAANVRGGGGASIGFLSNAILSKCTFSKNKTRQHGGGVWINKSPNAQVQECLFTENNASDAGGGIFVQESLNVGIADCVFDANTSQGTLTIQGGGAIGLRTESSAALERCLMKNNKARRGGAVFNWEQCTLEMVDCKILGSTVPDTPGLSGDGGGILNGVLSTVYLTNCEIVGNFTLGRGGGLANASASTATLTNSTVADNISTGQGGGLINDGFGVSMTLTNCIVWENADNAGMGVDSQIAKNPFPPTVSHSCIQDENPNDVTIFPGIGNLDDDPRFIASPNPGPDAMWGSVDDNFGNVRLQFISPCIDAGNNTALPPAVTTDLAGNPRYVDNLIAPDTGVGTPPIVDLGPFEAPESVPADIDVDGDVDAGDFAFFAACFNRAGNPPRGGCSPDQSKAFDFDGDLDIDGVDFAGFAQCFNNAGNPPRLLGCPQY